jgi:hypothetical protein
MLIASSTANAYGGGTPDAQPRTPACSEPRPASSEANDCEAQVGQGDDAACSTLRRQCVRNTGALFFPCELDHSRQE